MKELDNPALTPDRRARLGCRVAAGLIHAGQYEAARDALGTFWRGAGVRPDVENLEVVTAAEVLLLCGTLSGWLGSSGQGKSAQEAAKDLISEALRLFESYGLSKRAAEAQYEIAMCYWRLGALDEARVILREALRALDDGDVEQKGRILIRSTLIEISDARYQDALQLLEEAEPVVKLADDALKGKWHAQMALVLRCLGTADGQTEYLDRAIIEYTAAAFHFEQAKHERYRGDAENNLAFLLCKLGRYDEAHRHLDRAHRIFARLDDPGSLAQVDETRARVLLAEQRYEAAAALIDGAVETLEKGGDSALLADALIVQATIQARRGDHDRSLPIFRRAINLAEDAGAPGVAGQAALAMIEEHGEMRLSESEIYNVYRRADELLAHTQDIGDVVRLRACARIVLRRATSAKLTNTNFSLAAAVRDFEARFIERALKDEGGSISRAAKRLGVKHQTLAYLLKTRHKHLSEVRKPIIRRRRSIMNK